MRERQRGRESERMDGWMDEWMDGGSFEKLTGTHGIARLAANPGRCRFSVLHLGLI